MDIVAGFVVGVALVAPVGPISLLLIGVGLERGRVSGVWAGLGVAAADVALLTLVVALSRWLTVLDPGWQRTVDVGIGVLLAGVGLHALVTRRGIGAMVERIRHPARALALATVANPMTIAVWLGLVVSLTGDQTGGTALVRLAVGLGLATTVWHVGLGFAAGSLGRHIGDGPRLALQRVSGAVLLVLGVGLLW